MDTGSLATDAPTEMNQLHVELPAGLGFVVSREEYRAQVPRGAFWAFMVLGCGCFSNSFTWGILWSWSAE